MKKEPDGKGGMDILKSETFFPESRSERLFSVTAEKKTAAGFYPLHWHDLWELELVLRGTGIQKLNGREYPMTPGCLTLLRPTDFHEVITDTEMMLYRFSFQADFLSEKLIFSLLQDQGDLIFSCKDASFEDALFFSSLLYNDCRGGSLCPDLFQKNMVECLLITLLRGRAETGIAPVFPDPPVRKEALFLHLHFRNSNLVLEDASDAAGLNRRYFSRLFHQILGQTFTEYLTGLRLNYAKKLLAVTRLSIAEIAQTAGFATFGNFSKAFKKAYGAVPREFRKNL